MCKFIQLEFQKDLKTNETKGDERPLEAEGSQEVHPGFHLGGLRMHWIDRRNSTNLKFREKLRMNLSDYRVAEKSSTQEME